MALALPGYKGEPCCAARDEQDAQQCGADPSTTAGCRGEAVCLTHRDALSVAGVQDRMPVILQETLFGKWLDPNVVSAAEVQAMVNEAQSDFVHHAVTTRLDSAKIDEREFANPA